MKGSATKSMPLISAIVFPLVAYLAPATVSAQTEHRRPGGRPVVGTNTSPSRKPSIRERQLIMDAMAREVGRPRSTDEKRIALVQIADDFQQIQMVNNKMMEAAMKAATLDYGDIGSSTAEIKKRASRLKSNLELPSVEPDAKSKQEYKPLVDAAGMKAALLSLDKSIMSFVESPIFKNPNVIDMDQTSKAIRDLDIIIEFSRLISKDAERLGKSSSKRP